MKLKKVQIYDRLKKIKEISGTTDDHLKNVDLTEEFDPDAHDKQMSDVFDESYYNEAEEKPEFGEDEDEGYIPISKFDRYMQTDYVEKLQNDVNFEKYLDEYYQLDYEDMIAGMPCRFKYTEVQPRAYGLDAKKILETEDTELKRIISTKRLAPYRDDQGKRPYRPGYGREWSKGGRGGRGKGVRGRQRGGKGVQKPNKNQKTKSKKT